MSAPPKDPAISAKLPESAPPTFAPKSKPSVPYSHLTPAEQTAQDLENAIAFQQAQGVIDPESDDNLSDYLDSGYNTNDAGSATTSLSSRVRDYTFENGRRYHKFREGAYNFPNDDAEQDRENMKHATVVNLCQQLHFAPIGENPLNILDMGTGTGIWAVEMGDQYPSANVSGVDLSPIQPSWVPPNVKFFVDDVESPWVQPENHFDYIHARHTVMAIKNWPKLMERALFHLKPGGWFELQEIHHKPQCHDNSMPAGHPVVEFWTAVTAGLAALGVNLNATLDLADMLRAAGFVNVTTKIFQIPIGVWPKSKVLKVVGLYWRTILLDGVQPIALGPLTRGLGWSKEEVEVWLVKVRQAYMEGRVHSYMPLHIICGQKPPGGAVQG